jgi:glucan endo-1,3-alpha-glucosidase
MVHIFRPLSWTFVAFLVTCLSSYTYAVPSSIQGKFVAAHWMVSGVAVDYKKHIQLAQANGVDAFALNFGGWNLETYREVWLKSIADIFAAAQALNSNFRLFFSFDLTSALTKQNVLDLATQYGAHPNHLWYQNKMFLSTFEGANAPFNWDTDIKAVLAAKGLPVYFVPMFNQWQAPAPNAYPFVDGLFRWTNPSLGFANDIKVDADYAALRAANGKTWMAGVAPWFFTHYNSKNWGNPEDDQIFFDKWERLLELKPDFIELVTWNDHGESSYLGPVEGVIDDQTWARLSHDALLDLSSYYHTAFKTGRKPAITEEKAYYFYRTHSLNAKATNDPLGLPEEMKQQKDHIFVITMLASAATVIVKSGSKTYDPISVPAGAHKVGVPFHQGVQTVTVHRGNTQVMGGTGDTPISDNIRLYNGNIVAGMMTANGGQVPIPDTTKPFTAPPATPAATSTAATNSGTCPNQDRYQRKDCQQTNKQSCEAANCCWSPLEEGSGQPWCYIKP